MPYANWNPTAFYNADDVVVYNGEDYQALAANHNVIPFGNNPPWNPIAPPGPGPSNQLAFNKPTTDLSIIGGNTIDISPQLGYTSGTTPTTNVLSVGNSSIALDTIPQLTFSETTTGVLTRPIISAIVDDPAPPPAVPPPFRLIDARSIKGLAENWVFYIDVQAGNNTIGSEFFGVAGANLFLKAAPVIVSGGTGSTKQLRLRDDALAVEGGLWVRADGSLMWNGNLVSPP